MEKWKVVAFDDRNTLFEYYCGKSVVIFKSSSIDSSKIASFKKILAPQDMTALSCATMEEEYQLTKILIENDVSFKRSTQDIEILSLNAIGEPLND